MAENKSTGPSTGTIVLIAVLATPVVLLLVFWLIGSGSTTVTKTLPDVRYKGLQWASAETRSAGFDAIESHDALGRDRRWRDDKEWQVCFEDPAAGVHDATTTVRFGVVKIEERCPQNDQARYDPAGPTMPDLTDRTAYIATRILGPNASIRFLDREEGDDVSRGFGDWRVCGQSPKSGNPFDGVPVTLTVVPYEERC